jgi:hypothetical protein
MAKAKIAGFEFRPWPYGIKAVETKTRGWIFKVNKNSESKWVECDTGIWLNLWESAMLPHHALFKELWLNDPRRWATSTPEKTHQHRPLSNQCVLHESNLRNSSDLRPILSAKWQAPRSHAKCKPHLLQMYSGAPIQRAAVNGCCIIFVFDFD